MTLDLPLIWAGLIAFAVLLYVVLDGFDLGVGILFPFVTNESDRDQMMNSVAPVWDGNETWLVLGGGGLFAVFPLAYAIVMPALYVPLIVMLLALIFRGVAFEFRFKTHGAASSLWDWRVRRRLDARHLRARHCARRAWCRASRSRAAPMRGGWWDWLTPFSVLTRSRAGGRLCAARSDVADLSRPRATLQRAAYRFAWIAGAAIAGTDRHREPVDAIPERELHGALVRLAAVALRHTGAAAGRAVRVALYRGLSTKRELMPFLASLGLFILSFIGL